VRDMGTHNSFHCKARLPPLVDPVLIPAFRTFSLVAI
jgi:hypothetical protein